MPKQIYTLRQFQGGMSNRRDPRDIKEHESSYIKNMSIDSLGKIKTSGGLYDHKEGADGTTDLPEYIPGCTANLSGIGGYGMFYFQADHGREPTYTITDTKHPGSSNALVVAGYTLLLNTNWSINDATIELAVGDTTTMIVGMNVNGPDKIPDGATVASITDSDTFELSANATGSLSTQSLQLIPYGAITFTAGEEESTSENTDNFSELVSQDLSFSTN